MAEKTEETVYDLEIHEPIRAKLTKPTISQQSKSASAEFDSSTIHTANKNEASRSKNGTSHGSNSK
jgi:hypothetical protein